MTDAIFGNDKKKLEEMQAKQEALQAQQDAAEEAKKKELEQQRIAGLRATMSGFGGSGLLQNGGGNGLGKTLG